MLLDSCRTRSCCPAVVTLNSARGVVDPTSLPENQMALPSGLQASPEIVAELPRQGLPASSQVDHRQPAGIIISCSQRML